MAQKSVTLVFGPYIYKAKILVLVQVASNS